MQQKLKKFKIMKYEIFLIDILDVITVIIIMMGNEIFQPQMKILGEPLFEKKITNELLQQVDEEWLYIIIVYTIKKKEKSEFKEYENYSSRGKIFVEIRY